MWQDRLINKRRRSGLPWSCVASVPVRVAQRHSLGFVRWLLCLLLLLQQQHKQQRRPLSFGVMASSPSSSWPAPPKDNPSWRNPITFGEPPPELPLEDGGDDDDKDHDDDFMEEAEKPPFQQQWSQESKTPWQWDRQNLDDGLIETDENPWQWDQESNYYAPQEPLPAEDRRRNVQYPQRQSTTANGRTIPRRPPPPQQPPPPPPTGSGMEFSAASAPLEEDEDDDDKGGEKINEGDEEEEQEENEVHRRPFPTSKNNNKDYEPIDYPFRNKDTRLDDDSKARKGAKDSSRSSSSWFGWGRSKKQPNSRRNTNDRGRDDTNNNRRPRRGNISTPSTIENDEQDDWFDIGQQRGRQRQDRNDPQRRPLWADPSVGRMPPPQQSQGRRDPRRRHPNQRQEEEDDDVDKEEESERLGQDSRNHRSNRRPLALDPVARYMSQSRWHRYTVYFWASCLGAAMGGYVGQSILNQIHPAAPIGAIVFGCTSAWTRRNNPYGELTRAAGLAFWLTVKEWHRIRRVEYPTTPNIRALLQLRPRKPFPPRRSDDNDDERNENIWNYRPEYDDDVPFEMASSLLCLSMVGFALGGSIASSTPLVPSWMGALGGAATLAILTTRRDARGDLCRIAGMRLRRTLGAAWTVCTQEVPLPHHTGIVAREILDKLLILDRQHRLRDRLTTFLSQFIQFIQRLVRQRQEQEPPQRRQRRQPPPLQRRRRPRREESPYNDGDEEDEEDFEENEFNPRQRPNRGPNDNNRRGPPPPPPQGEQGQGDDDEGPQRGRPPPQRYDRRQQKPPLSSAQPRW